MIVAGIVSFNPDIERLKENIEGVIGDVARLAIFDNGSGNLGDIVDLAKTFEDVQVLRSAQNVGIAEALNGLADWAEEHGARWLLTLDQDSVALPGMVDELDAVAQECGAALVSPTIIDRNKPSEARQRDSGISRFSQFRQAARRGAITSGALLELASFRRAGGFDPTLFIDYVDYDLNQRIMFSGGEIYRANRAYLLHEVGRAKSTWLKIPRKDMSGSWHLETFHSFGHSPTRCYYKGRNRVIFTRKYGRRLGVSHEGVWQIPQQVALTVLFEDQRWSKLMNFARGVRDGLSHPLFDPQNESQERSGESR